jgi:hypothetical protein
MNVEAPGWVAQPTKRDAPIGDALRRLLYGHEREVPADLENLLNRLRRRS